MTMWYMYAYNHNNSLLIVSLLQMFSKLKIVANSQRLASSPRPLPQKRGLWGVDSYYNYNYIISYYTHACCFTKLMKFLRPLINGCAISTSCSTFTYTFVLGPMDKCIHHKTGTNLHFSPWLKLLCQVAFGQTRSLHISLQQNLETAGQSLYIRSWWY